MSRPVLERIKGSVMGFGGWKMGVEVTCKGPSWAAVTGGAARTDGT